MFGELAPPPSLKLGRVLKFLGQVQILPNLPSRTNKYEQLHAITVVTGSLTRGQASSLVGENIPGAVDHYLGWPLIQVKWSPEMFRPTRFMQIYPRSNFPHSPDYLMQNLANSVDEAS